LIIRAAAAAVLLLSISVMAHDGAGRQSATGRGDYSNEISDFRKARLKELSGDDGWLSLAGLFWLKEGQNKVGTSPESDVVLPKEGAPSYTCSIWIENGKVRLEAPAESGITIAGKPVTALALEDDLSGKPTVLNLGSLSFHVIKRNDKYGLRLKDKDSPVRANFKGIQYYPVDPSWRIEARFEPCSPPKSIKIVNILGMAADNPSPGAIVFSRNGQTFRLDPIGELSDKELFVMLSDRTTGKETYHSGRYLYVQPPSADGKVVIDFNKAINPPCAFTKFATCPLPPPQNRLPIAVEAGEKYSGESH